MMIADKMSEADILKAIYDDDALTVERRLRVDRTLAIRRVGEAKLYEGKIFHWLYAGDTALHLAAAGHRVEITRSLLAAGADPNSCANHRQSGPLHYAADGCPGTDVFNPERQVETMQCLLEAGAEINAPDKNGATPLHRAVRTRCAAAVKHLLESGCKVLLKNKSGSTPFHLAVQNTGRGGSGSENAIVAQREIIKVFLAKGVSVRLKDGNGKSVHDCAKSSWIREMLSI
jgi:hypothetical protein